MGLLDWQPEHHFRSQVDQVQLQHLRHEGEGARGTQVTLDDEDIVITGHILDIERTVDVQGLGNLTRDTLDAAHGLHIEFLRWELNRGIA